MYFNFCIINGAHFRDLGMVAANLLHRASKGAKNATDSQPFEPKSERATTDFDDDDQVERNHFMDIHFPDEGIDANDLLNEFSDSSTIVKNVNGKLCMLLFMLTYMIMKNANFYSMPK